MKTIHTNHDKNVKLNEIKQKMKQILDSKTTEELRSITFSVIYIELRKYYTQSEIIQSYIKIVDLFYRYIRNRLVSAKNKQKVLGKKKVQKTRKIINLKPGTKRCPKTYRKYKDGLCDSSKRTHKI